MDKPKTYLLSGDILHPAYISVQAHSLKEALEKADRGEFLIEDEQHTCLGFTFDGNILNEEEFTDEELSLDG